MNKKELIESFKAISKKWRVEFLIFYILFYGATLAIMVWKGESLIFFHCAFFCTVITTVLIMFVLGKIFSTSFFGIEPPEIEIPWIKIEMKEKERKLDTKR
ncbi:MAG: hypothetical protein HXS52_04325 [Theionarchaea archaeon]|nr:hypothetical protein [Theionarchaea archaeon]